MTRPIYSLKTYLMYWELQNFIYCQWITERDESEASRPPSCRILHDHDLGEFAKDGKIFTDGFRGCLPRKASDKHLPWIIGNIVTCTINQNEKNYWIAYQSLSQRLGVVEMKG